MKGHRIIHGEEKREKVTGNNADFTTDVAKVDGPLVLLEDTHNRLSEEVWRRFRVELSWQIVEIRDGTKLHQGFKRR